MGGRFSEMTDSALRCRRTCGVAGKDVPWDGLTCDRLLEMAYKVIDGVRNGGGDAVGWGLQYEKLTHGYWRNFIREKMLEGAGEACFFALYFNGFLDVFSCPPRVLLVLVLTRLC